MYFGPRLTVLEHASLSLAATLPFAILSWIAIEKPALRLKHHLRKLSVEKNSIRTNEYASDKSIDVYDCAPYEETKNRYL
ncbi:hypothetical protein [Methylorubrum thiocyanatum]|uniref:hypothetical protein n=1 Tax=Methylorubrum thiocyanatum TaxID=47958 RepID=UPI0035C85C24